MKKLVTFLMSAILLTCSVNLSAKTEKNQTNTKLTNITYNSNSNEEVCNFRFVLKNPGGINGWVPEYGIMICVDGVDYGIVTLPWETPYVEEIVLLPSGDVHFFWTADNYNPSKVYFEIYNSFDELIYTSPAMIPDWLFFTYQNECPECIPLTDFEGEYIEEAKQVNLTWSVPESEFLTGFDIYRNNEWIAQVDSVTNSYSENTEGFEEGIYKYCVVPVYQFECNFDEACFEFEIEGVGIKNYASGFHLYPNPASHTLTIAVDKWTSGQVDRVEIYDVLGRKQKAEGRKQKAEGRKQKGEETIVIDISNLPNGIYFVEIATEKGTITKKMIKQ